MKIQGDTTVYIARSGFVEGEVTAQVQPGMPDRVVLILGGGLTVSLLVEYAESLAKDIQEALVEIKTTGKGA